MADSTRHAILKAALNAAGAPEMALSKTTRDHDEIRKWAESRGAVPAEVTGTEKNGQTGILRFEFKKAPRHNDSKLQEIPWDEFFEKFDENDLELVYQEKTADGERSNFNKLIHPDSEEHSSRSKSHGGSHVKKSTGDDNESKSESRRSSGKSQTGATGNSHGTAEGGSQSDGTGKSTGASTQEFEDTEDMEDLDDTDEDIDDDDDIDDDEVHDADTEESRHSSSKSHPKSIKSSGVSKSKPMSDAEKKPVASSKTKSKSSKKKSA